MTTDIFLASALGTYVETCHWIMYQFQGELGHHGQTFCQSLGLAPEEVRFIQVGSDFPIENRPIYPMNIAYLNYSNLKLQEVKTALSRAIDNFMTLHRNHKGIIHTTYEQLNFIKENISEINKRRLLVTDRVF
jgi:ATP-dependent DNA helicase DinG